MSDINNQWNGYENDLSNGINSMLNNLYVKVKRNKKCRNKNYLSH